MLHLLAEPWCNIRPSAKMVDLQHPYCGPASGKADFAGLLLGPAANIQESNLQAGKTLQNCCCRSYPVLVMPQFSPCWCLTPPPMRHSKTPNQKIPEVHSASWDPEHGSITGDPFKASTLQKLTYNNKTGHVSFISFFLVPAIFCMILRPVRGCHVRGHFFRVVPC